MSWLFAAIHALFFLLLPLSFLYLPFPFPPPPLVKVLWNRLMHVALSWFVLPKVSPSFYQSIIDISALTHQHRLVQTVSNSTTGTYTQVVPRKYEY